MSSMVIDLDRIGPVTFEKSRRARRLNITIRPFRGVRVAVPLRVSIARAKEYALSKAGWIRKHLARMKKVESAQGVLLKRAAELDVNAARRTLVDRLAELARRNGFSYNRVSIRRQKTRWGSCSSRNNISLNMSLVLLPLELMDYVILHELLHTRIRNHSRRFWAELDTLVGDARAFDARMKEYSLGFL